MRISCDDIELLFSGEINELDGIAGDADGEVGVFGLFRMFHRILELIDAEDVDVEMVCSLIEVTVEYVDEVACTLIFIIAKSRRADRLGVGDAVQCIFIRQLGDAVERCEQTVLFGAIGRVGTRGERLKCLASIGQCACRLAIDDVASELR